MPSDGRAGAGLGWASLSFPCPLLLHEQVKTAVLAKWGPEQENSEGKAAFFFLKQN